jgi:4-hydroxy-tetrahydrodipicolinate synthase
MNMKQFRGLGVAIVTPFKADGSIDYHSWEKMLKTVNDVADYVVLFGTTGESPVIALDEKKDIINFFRENLTGKTKLVVGIGGNDTKKLIKEIEQIDFAGISGVLSVCPYYNKPSQEGIFQHYKAIAEASPAPIIVYNVPGRTVINIEAHTTLRIANELKNVVALKEATNNLDQLMDILDECPDDFTVLSGDDALALSFISMGADGVISVIANAFPRAFAKMTSFALQGNIEEARKYHYALLPLMHALLKMGNPAGIKAVLTIMGRINEYFRLPLVPISSDNYKILEKEVENTIKKLSKIDSDLF